VSIFGKPLSQLTTADLQELLQDKATENARLEFKREVPGRDETLKKLSSFANTFGGIVVVGAAANSADGRIEDLPGVDETPGYKQKVVDWCFGGASPPLTVAVSDPIPVPTGGGKVCYVIDVPESDVAPHFLNGRRGVWVRTDEFSGRFEAGLANDNELRHLLDRRKLIVERRGRLLSRARERFQRYVAAVSVGPRYNTIESGPRLEVCIGPRFPARPLCEERDLEALIKKNYLNWHQTLFPNPSSGVVSQHESAIVLREAEEISMVEANIWGMLFYGVQFMYEDWQGAKGVNLHPLLGYVLVFIRHAEQILRVMGYSGPVIVDVTLAAMLGTRWVYSSVGPWVSAKEPGRELDNSVTFSIETTTDELRERPDRLAMNLLRYIFFSLNWSDRIATQQQLEELVLKGYDYNLWPRSAGLRA